MRTTTRLKYKTETMLADRMVAVADVESLCKVYTVFDHHRPLVGDGGNPVELDARPVESVCSVDVAADMSAVNRISRFAEDSPTRRWPICWVFVCAFAWHCCHLCREPDVDGLDHGLLPKPIANAALCRQQQSAKHCSPSID